MSLDRRHLLAVSALHRRRRRPHRVAPRAAVAAPLSIARRRRRCISACAPAARDDQSRTLQRAIDQAAGARVPLVLGPGVYRAGDLKLPSGAQIVGVRGATRLVFTGGPSLDLGDAAPTTSRSPASCSTAPACRCRRAAASCISRSGRDVRITDCEIVASRPQRHRARGVEGEVTGTTVADVADTAIFSLDARGLVDRAQHRARRRQQRHPGVALGAGRRRHAGHRQPHRGHRQREPAAPGQNGNAINVFRAANVIVRGNRIRGAAFSGGARQRRLQHADHRQQLHRRRRGRDLCRVRLRGRGDRQQHGRRRRARRRGDQFQRRRPARGGAGQPHPQPRAASARPAPTRTTSPASASASRPTPRSPATSSRTRRAPASSSAGAQLSARRHRDRQRGAHRRRRHRRVGRARRRHRGDRRQPDLRRHAAARSSAWSGRSR